MGLGGVPPVFADEQRDEERDARATTAERHRRAGRTNDRIGNARPEPARDDRLQKADDSGAGFRSGGRSGASMFPAWQFLASRHAPPARHPSAPTELEAAAARQRARERAGEDEHPRKSGPARGGKG